MVGPESSPIASACGAMATLVPMAEAAIAAAAITFLITGQVLSDETPSTEATWSTAATGKGFSPSPRRRTPGRVVGPYEKWAGGRQGLSFPRSRDRKSTRLNSSHVKISYAVVC